MILSVFIVCCKILSYTYFFLILFGFLQAFGFCPEDLLPYACNKIYYVKQRKVVKISLEEVVGYSELRARYLKDAEEFYGKELWKDGYLKTCAYVGTAIGTSGAALKLFFDSNLFLIPTGVGLVTMLQAYLKKRKVAKVVTGLLDKRTAGITYEALEERVKSKNYEPPEATKEELQENEMNLYALRCMEGYDNKEHSLLGYPWPWAGLGIAAYGLFTASSNPVTAGATLTAGSLVFLISNVMKQRKLANVAKDVSVLLKEKGYDYFVHRIKNKDPYDFYRKHFMKDEYRDVVQ